MMVKIKMKKIIAFGGQAGMGKDTAADEFHSLFKQNELQSYRTSFAEGVKNIFCKTFAVEKSTMESTKRDPNPMKEFEVSTRKALQKIGDGFREIKKTVWIEQLLERVKHIEDGTTTLISDLRYENEADLLKRNKAILVLIGRSAMLNDDSNASESYIGNQVKLFLKKYENSTDVLYDLRNDDTTIFDFFIMNNDSLEEFKKVLSKLYEIL